MTQLTLLLAIVASVAIAGCGGQPPPVAPPPLEDLDDAPRQRIAGIELPRMPLDVEADDHELEDGLVRAEEALTMAAPRPPRGTITDVEAWAEDDLSGWMERRADAVSAALRALDSARHGRPEYSVVASAVLGLVYARFAMDLRGIPTPDALSESETRTDAFREAMERAAEPLWLRALDAFGSCSSVAGNAPVHSLENWREWCDAQLRSVSRLLPDQVDDDEDDDDEDEDDDESRDDED